MKRRPDSLFISYSRKDERFRKELDTHLIALKRNGAVSVWSDRCIPVGARWEEQIDEHLVSADIVLFLLSPDFMASDYCYEKEVSVALERHSERETVLFPIIVRPVSLENSVFSGIQALPRTGKPIVKWANRDEAWVHICRELVDFQKVRDSRRGKYDLPMRKARAPARPPFTSETFLYSIERKCPPKSGLARVPCSVFNVTCDDALAEVLSLVQAYYKRRAEILYDVHIDLWAKSELTADGRVITDEVDRTARFREIRDKYRPDIPPLCILVSGETGSGKTTLAREVSTQLGGDYLSLESTKDPLVSTLAELEKQAPSPLPDQFGEKARILAVDSLDKYNPSASRKEIRRYVEALMEHCPSYQCRIVFTRSNFLGRYIDEGFFAFSMVKLLPLYSDEVAKVAKEISGSASLAAAIGESHLLGAISTNPLLLSMIISLSGRGCDLAALRNREDLFARIVDAWLMRDAQISLLSSGARRTIMKRLAVVCLGRGSNVFDYDDISAAIAQQLGDLSPEMSERVNRDLQTCSFLRLREDGGFEFAHTAFQEYCIARAVFEDLLATDYTTFSWASFNPEIIDYLVSLMQRFGKIEAIRATLAAALHAARDSRRRANILKLAGRLGGVPLELDGVEITNETLVGVDFSGLDICGARFTGCDFAGTDLARLRARNWLITECNFIRGAFESVEFSHPVVESSIFRVGYGDSVTVRFGSFASVELVVDVCGYLDFIGGSMSESVVESCGRAPTENALVKRSAVKYAQLDRTLFGPSAAGFFLGFCSVDEVTLYSLHCLSMDKRPAMSTDIESACEQWQGDGSAVKAISSPHVRMGNEPEEVDTVRKFLTKTQAKRRRRIIAWRNADK